MSCCRERSDGGQEQMLLKAQAHTPTIGLVFFRVPLLVTVHNLFGKALEKNQANCII